MLQSHHKHIHTHKYFGGVGSLRNRVMRSAEKGDLAFWNGRDKTGLSNTADITIKYRYFCFLAT